MMIRFAASALICALIASAQQKPAAAPTANRIEVGRLANGAAVTFVRAGSGDWGLEIAGGDSARMMQPKPAQIEVYRGADNLSQLAAGYQSVQKEADAVVAQAKVAGGGEAAFAVEDRWKVAGAVSPVSPARSVRLMYWRAAAPWGREARPTRRREVAATRRRQPVAARRRPTPRRWAPAFRTPRWTRRN